MNIERLTQLAAALRGELLPASFNLPGFPRFSMPAWGAINWINIEGEDLPETLDRPCQTAGCIAGWTCALYETAKWLMWVRNSRTEWNVEDAARDLLGLNCDQSNWLFLGHGFAVWTHDAPLSKITNRDAANAIDWLLEHQPERPPCGVLTLEADKKEDDE